MQGFQVGRQGTHHSHRVIIYVPNEGIAQKIHWGLTSNQKGYALIEETANGPRVVYVPLRKMRTAKLSLAFGENENCVVVSIGEQVYYLYAVVDAEDMLNKLAECIAKHHYKVVIGMWNGKATAITGLSIHHEGPCRTSGIYIKGNMDPNTRDTPSVVGQHMRNGSRTGDRQPSDVVAATA